MRHSKGKKSIRKKKPSVQQKPKVKKNRPPKAVKYVPYARTYKVPRKQARLKAIGFGKEEIPIEYDATLDDKFFPPIPRPTSIDDWLADLAEEGQTFDQYTEECAWLRQDEKHRNVKHTFVPGKPRLADRYPEGKIYIVPIGDFDEEASFAFKDLLEFASRYLCLPVATLPNMELEFSGKKVMFGETELKTRRRTRPKHIQLQVSCILTELQRRVPDDAFFLLGLTMYDLYCSDPDLFVAGIAWGCNVAVFSIHRYNPRLTFSTEFWYDIKETEVVSDDDKKRLMLQHTCKLVVHEIGHLLGIGHCIFFSCCMNGSGHLEEDFRQPMHLCPVDLHKLHLLTGCDVVDRYERLGHFYTSHGMQAEADWVKRRIQFIQGKGKY